MNTMRIVCRMLLAGSLAVGGAGTVGCDDKKEPEKQPAPKPPPTDVTPKATANAATTKPTTVPTTRPSEVAILPSREGSAQRTREAQDLLMRAMQSINENKLDDARASLDKVDAMRESIPPAVRESATTVRGALAKAENLQRADLTSPADSENK